MLVNVTYVALLWETFERAEEKEISAQSRRMMRVRSFLTLAAFTIAMAMSVKFPLWGLGLVCCCLVFYVRPEAPRGVARGIKILTVPWHRRIP